MPGMAILGCPWPARKYLRFLWGLVAVGIIAGLPMLIIELNKGEIAVHYQARHPLSWNTTGLMSHPLHTTFLVGRFIWPAVVFTSSASYDVPGGLPYSLAEGDSLTCTLAKCTLFDGNRCSGAGLLVHFQIITCGLACSLTQSEGQHILRWLHLTQWPWK